MPRGTLLLAVAIPFVLTTLAGCSGETKSTATGPSNQQALIDLGDSLKYAESLKKRPPAKLAEMEQYEPLYPAGYLQIVKGEVVYAWGVGLNPAKSDTVLAYEKKAETDGGWVLLQDGTVKEMTAAEFQAAPKAGKK